jgi:serine/threonine protein kinase
MGGVLVARQATSETVSAAKMSEQADTERKHSKYRKRTQGILLSSRRSTKAFPPRTIFQYKVIWYSYSRQVLSSSEADVHEVETAAEQSTDRQKIAALMLSLVLPVDRSGSYRLDTQVNAAMAIWIDFLETLDMKEVGILCHLMHKEKGLGYANASKVLCDTGDSLIRLAIAKTPMQVRMELWDYFLFCGRYEIDRGRPRHYSNTSLVVQAKDYYVFETYLRVFHFYQLVDKVTDVPYLDREAFFDAVSDLAFELSEILQDLTEVDMELAFHDCSVNERVGLETFLHFCQIRIGETRPVMIKFMKKDAQYANETSVRHQLMIVDDSPLPSPKPKSPKPMLKTTSFLVSPKKSFANMSMARMIAKDSFCGSPVLREKKCAIFVAGDNFGSRDSFVGSPCLQEESSVECVMPVLEDFPLKPHEYIEQRRRLRSSSVVEEELRKIKLERIKRDIKNVVIGGVDSKQLIEYKRAIAMPVASRTLASELSETFDPSKGKLGKGFKVEEIKEITRELAKCLLELHSRQIVHGDLKPDNVAFVGKKLLLLDLDSAGLKYAGFKNTSAYLPPEMFWSSPVLPDVENVFTHHETRRRERIYFDSSAKIYYGLRGYDLKHSLGTNAVRNRHLIDNSYQLLELTASIDIWAFGMILFTLCTGKYTFFDIKNEDLGELSIDKYPIAYGLHDPGSIASTTLMKEIDSLVSDFNAQDLLRRIFVAPPKRIDMEAILRHPFLVEFRGRELKPKQLRGLTRFKENLLAHIRSKRPIHVALIRREPLDAAYLAMHLRTAKDVDKQGRTAVEIALKHLENSQVKSADNVTKSVLLTLILDSLQLEELTSEKTAVTQHLSIHRIWLRLLRCDHPVAFKVVQSILSMFQPLDLLVNCVEYDECIDCRHSPTILSINRGFIREATFICGRYDVSSGPTAEGSSLGQSLVVHADDYGFGLPTSTPVMLRFIQSKMQYLAEIRLREVPGSNDFIVPILCSYCLEDEADSGASGDERPDCAATAEVAAVFFCGCAQIFSP